jgi:RimJ/RimL family protein N-acetyltransferase
VQQIGMNELPDPLPDEVLARRRTLPRKPDPVVLTGERVVLRELDLDRDVEPLHAVSSGAPFTLGDRHVEAYDPDARIWRWMRGTPNRTAAELRAYLAPQHGSPDLRMLVVSDLPTGTPVGMACYMANRPEDLKVELGHIWYGPIAQGTGASREATRLMLGHAFGLGYRRVEWKCDARNERSRRAALSYGFRFECVQQAHMIVKGRSRDTAWFRMLDTEWPAVQGQRGSP